MEGVLKSSTQI